MPDAAPTPTLRFGPFELDEHSGELWRDQQGEPAVIRLAPQPARLLSHLIARRPHVVSREEIRRLLWPDVEVELEQSLHTCIRKIREALDDSPSKPRYVETIPRRGYRFVGEILPGSGVASGEGRRRRLLFWLAVASALAATLALALIWARATPSIRPTRVAVMSFEPRDGGSVIAANNDIAESLVEILTNDRSLLTEVIGPTTTRPYEERSKGIRQMISELDVDYVINTRESSGPAGRRLLIEIVRCRDGAHLWAKYLDELPADRTTAEVVAAAALEAMGSGL